VGRSRERPERVAIRDLATLAGLLDYPVPGAFGDFDSPWPGSAMPAFAHWLNGNPVNRQSELGEDGHVKKGVFLPDLPYPRRMWAGSRVQLLQDYQAGQLLVHKESIHAITHKTGRSGRMFFVTLQHDYFSAGELVLQEQQDMVYRAAIATALQKPELLPEADVLAGQDYDWCRPVHPDPVMLFRYSAATANSHRIHYDRDYVTATENYPGLLVHGPLTATLLIDLFIRNNANSRVVDFEFRSVRPLYDTCPFYIFGKQAEQGALLWALDCSGLLAMEMKINSIPL